MTTRPEPGSPLPQALADVVPDTAGLKALAHPDRLRMLGLLRVEGPATATALARRLGLNTGATSYHLRQLARHDFVEEMPERGNRRERWWQARHHATVFDPAEAEGPALEAGLALGEAVIRQHLAWIVAAHARYAELPVPWRRVTTVNDVVLPLDAEAAAALLRRLEDLLAELRTAHPNRAAPLPEGMRNVVLLLHTFPFPEDAPDPAPDGAP